MARTFIVRDERGASIIEMGLAAPLLATMLIGMVDLSRAYSAKLQVEQAAQRTIEKVQQRGFTIDQEAALESEAQFAAGGNATADVTFWLECNDNGTKLNFTSGSCSTGQTYSRRVEIRITKTYTPLFKMRWGNSANGYVVHGDAGVRIQ